MKLEKLALIAEIVGGIAIVVSLIFVGFQVQQNARTNAQTLTQGVVSDYLAAVVALGDTRETACIFGQAMQDYEAVTGPERTMFNNRIFAVFSTFQEMRALRDQGAFDPSIWSGFEGVITSALRSPGMRQWWSARNHFFGEDFQAYVDEIIRESPVAEPSVFDDRACTSTGPK